MTEFTVSSMSESEPRGGSSHPRLVEGIVERLDVN
jgi:hypothetical protein